MNARILMITLALGPASAVASPQFYFALAGGKSQFNQFEELQTAIYSRMAAEEFKLDTFATCGECAKREELAWAYTATAGADFGSHFAAELSYSMLAKPDFRTSSVGFAHLPENRGYLKYSQTMNAGIDGLALSVVGYVPLDLGYRIYGRVGALYARVNAKGTLCGIDKNTDAELYCSPQVTNDALTGEPIGGFASGHLGDVRFSARSVMPTLSIGFECTTWSGLGWRVDYSVFGVRNPKPSNDAPPLQGVPSTGVIQFLSLAATFNLTKLTRGD